MKALVIGRHVPDFGGIADIEIVKQEAVTFPATAAECVPVLVNLVEKAIELDAKVLLQNTPGQVAAAIPRLSEDYRNRIGVVISKPGERLAGVKTGISLSDASAITEFERVLKVVNSRAKIEYVYSDGFVVGIEVTVDPPMRFEFSHIEWF